MDNSKLIYNLVNSPLSGFHQQTFYRMSLLNSASIDDFASPRIDEEYKKTTEEDVLQSRGCKDVFALKNAIVKDGELFHRCSLKSRSKIVDDMENPPISSFVTPFSTSTLSASPMVPATVASSNHHLSTTSMLVRGGAEQVKMIDPRDIVKEEYLGGGRFGKVWRCKYYGDAGGVNVAVKFIDIINITHPRQSLTRFYWEKLRS